MFDIHCPSCDTRRLIFPSQIRGLVNHDGVIHVAYRCWCGEAGVWRTGAEADPPRELPAAS